MSGVNCNRENLTLRQFASDFTESVLANPGTPSSSTCPLASNPITSRSTRYVWPTITLPNSLNSGRTNAPASCTASLIALIPVFIGSEILLSDGHQDQKMCSTEIWHLNCFLWSPHDSAGSRQGCLLYTSDAADE